MNPGSELDHLIADFVMKDSVYLNYSTDVAAAWRVIDKFKAQLYDVELYFVAETNKWGCLFQPMVGYSVRDKRSFCQQHTAAHAICEAALRGKDER